MDSSAAISCRRLRYTEKPCEGARGDPAGAIGRKLGFAAGSRQRTPEKESGFMAFGFFGRRFRKNRREESVEHSATPENSPDDTNPDFTPVPGRRPGDSVEQKVERDGNGILTPADFLPDTDLPQLNRSRAN